LPVPAAPAKGKQMLKTLEKEQARDFVRQSVTEHLEPLLEAQIDNAVDSTNH